MIDCHCHLSDERIFSQAKGLIQEALFNGVTGFSLGGTDFLEWKRQLEIKKHILDLNPTSPIRLNFGLHPWWVERLGSEQELVEALENLESSLSHANGIGETGLDFGKKRDPQKFELQRLAFRRQVELALQHRKPLVLHVVSAHEEVMKCLKEWKADHLRIQVHRFSGNEQELKQWLSFPHAMISFCGMSQMNRFPTSLVALTPVSRILLESDAPDGLSQPSEMKLIYENVAFIKGVTLENLITAISKNFNFLYEY